MTSQLENFFLKIKEKKQKQTLPTAYCWHIFIQHSISLPETILKIYVLQHKFINTTLQYHYKHNKSPDISILFKTNYTQLRFGEPHIGPNHSCLYV